MRRLGIIAAAFLIVILLVVAEIIVIKSATNYEPLSDVVFAKVKIPERLKITADMLEVKKIGKDLAHRLSLGNIQDAVGREAGTDIEAGEMVLSSKLGYEGMEKIKVKDKSKRLFSVEFKGDQANGWWLVTDQHVDIIFVPDKNAQMSGAGNGQQKNGDAAANTTGGRVQKLKNIRIAALIDENGRLLKNKDRTSLPKYISFEVTDEEVDFLAYAKGGGRLEISVIPE